MSEALCLLRDVEKSYKTAAGQTFVLRRINLDIEPGDFITIMGPSGAGKSTLLAIPVVGLYSVMSYLVAQRTREIGVRMALGARPGDVSRLVVGQGLKLTALGLGLGVIGALALRHVLAKLVVGVDAIDPVTVAGVGALLGAAALLASWLPARRAARVDPMIALRAE